MYRLFLCAALSLNVLAKDIPSPPALRLGHDVEPRSMQVDMTVDPAKTGFSGSVSIELNVKTPVDHLWLNATDLKISTATLQQSSSKIKTEVVGGGPDFVGFVFPAPLQPGPARLDLTYSGAVNLRSSEGVFRSENKGDAYLFTQFEPLDARRAFPCFDEPDFKIPWQLALRIPKSDVAVSNTGVENESNGDLKVVRFRQTKPLPSYLIAFAVGPLEFVDAGTAGQHHIPVRIVVPRGEKVRAQYAASISAEILNRLESYFGIPYPYDKSDQLAVPMSFGGAMENPGLVTYDANIILSPTGQDTPTRQRQYASIAAHELSHQWFGDMVTMAWWNDVWLNESFATWMSAKLIAGWKPEWDSRAADQTSRLKAVAADTETSARRINQPAESKSDIGSAFDSITYQKGGSVLAMFENAIGPDRFQKAVHNYLLAHLFGNARAEDFLAAIGKASSPHYESAFSTFLNQNGVPQLSVDIRCSGSAKPVVSLKQQRFLPVGSEGSTDAAWNIPVCLAYSYGEGRKQTCSLMREKSAEVALEGRGCPSWVLANAQELGYYVASYPAPLLSQLIDHRQDLSLAEQAGLLGDVRAQADAGTLPLNIALSLASKVANDTRYQTATAAVDLATIRGQYIPDRLRSEYAKFISKTFAARARQVGWTKESGESQDVSLLRPHLVPFVAEATDDEELVRKAKALATKWLQDRSVVTPDMVRPLLAVAAAHGDERFFNDLLAGAKQEQDAYYRPIMVEALGRFRDRTLALRGLNLAFNGTFDPRVSMRIVLVPEAEPELARLRYEYIKAHYAEFASKLPTGIGMDYAAYLPRVAAVAGCSSQDFDEAKAFFTPKMQNVQGGPRSLANALEAIHLCAAGKPNAERELEAFFSGTTTPRASR